MKYKKALTILLFIFITGCSNKNKFLNLPKINELPKKYVYTTGKCIVNNTRVEYNPLKRGQVIDILKEDDKYYYFNDDELILAVDKNYIRTSEDDKFVEFNGYTSKNSVLYDDYEFSKEVLTFDINDEIKVIDCFLDVAVVETKEGVIGYMRQSNISHNKYVISAPVHSNEAYIPSGDSGYSDDGGHSGGGGGGSSYEPSDSTPSDSEPPAQTSGDGEDIELSFNGIGKIVLLVNNGKKEGIVLADGIKTYITFMNRDDVIYVENEDETCYSIIFNGYKCHIDKKYVRLDKEKKYAEWDGYARNSVFIYEDIDCQNSIKKYDMNDIVRIIDEIDDLFIVDLGVNGIGYTRKNNISKEKIVYVEKKVEVNNNDVSIPTYDDNGGHASYSAPSNPEPSEPSPPPQEESEWTEPVL